jgi:DNA-binding CsgD family transcriptional regulator
MGTVWAAEHLLTRQKVALKLVRRMLSHKPGLRRRMLREARVASSLRHPNVVRVLAARGRRDLLEATAQPDLDRVELPPIAALSVMSSWGFAELCSGNWSTAVALLRRAHEAAAALEVEDDRVSPYHADLIEALVRIDAVDEAAQVSMALDSIAERSGEPEAAADSARCRAIIAAAQGNLAVADAEFATALTLSDAHRRPFDRARTLLAVGEHQRRRRRRAASRGTLARARTIFEQLGAHAWIERVDSELALLGRGSDARSLTSAELRVARLVAAGRRNKEIAAELTISIRTVEWTVAAIYRKLGVSTRVAIGQELLRGADPAAPPGADAPR